MNAFVQKLHRAYSVMKRQLRETPWIQERMKIETTAEMPLFHGMKSNRLFWFVRENLNILINM